MADGVRTTRVQCGNFNRFHHSDGTGDHRGPEAPDHRP